MTSPLTASYRSPKSPGADYEGSSYGKFLDDQFGRWKLDDVQWECHLSSANASKTIHDQLLTIHYISAIKEYSLPTPLLKGGLAWFRVSYYK
jgi:hypothetical protein